LKVVAAMEFLKNDYVIFGSLGGLAAIAFFPQLLKLAKLAKESVAPTKKVDALGDPDEDALDFAAYTRLKRRAEGLGIEAAIAPLNLMLPSMFGPSAQKMVKPKTDLPGP
jgi:hypothetical protein